MRPGTGLPISIRRLSLGRRWSVRPEAPHVPSSRHKPDRGLDVRGRWNRRRNSGRVRLPAAHLLRRSVADLVSFGVAPEAFEAVERATLATEDVHDEVEVIEQDPFRFVDALRQRRTL